jgi:hypothetical protein
MSTDDDWTPPAKSGKAFPKHPPGSARVVLADGLRLGLRVATDFKTKDRYLQDRMVLLWQSEEVEPESGQRYELATEFTYTADPKGNLPKLLAKWLGLTEDTEDALQRLVTGIKGYIGKSGLGTIEHKQVGEKSYVNLTAVAPLHKSMTPLTVESYTRNEWWAKKKAKYAEEVAAFRVEQERKAADFGDVPDAMKPEDDDDLPF